MFIAIEGLDGSGKTSILELLIKRYNIEKLQKRTQFFRDGVHAARYNSSSPHNLHITFLMAFGETSNRLANEKIQEKHQAVTKWLGGEVTAYYLHLKSLDVSAFNIDYKHLPIAKPDKVFYLKPSYELRLARLEERRKHGILDYFDQLTMQPEVENLFENVMKEVYDKYHIINTGQSIEKSCKQIMDILKL